MRRPDDAATPATSAEAACRPAFALTDSEARELISLIYEHSGIVLTRDKKSLISSRLHKRLQGVGAAFVPGISGLPAALARAAPPKSSR